jgi:phosphomannomutase
MGIFKAYDIRGKFPAEIDEAFARRLGRAIADYFGNTGSLALGYDMRSSSPGLTAALAEGLHDGGVSTLEIGLCTTPTLWYLVGSRELTGGVMVTASHNPADYNGFKICREKVIPVGLESGLADIQALCDGPAPAPVSERGQGSAESVLEGYLDHVVTLGGAVTGRPLKVAFDTGNGVVGPTLRRMLERWPGVEPVELFFEPDGTFPNHPANPLVLDNLVDLQAAVKEHACQVGVAFDGDGDRCVFVDELGEVVLSDLITALLAREELGKHPGASIVYDLCSSRVVREEIEAAGGVAVEERVGHAYIKATLRAQDAPFGGENSGHYYFREHWFADSGLIAAGRVLSLLASSDQTMSQVVAPLRRTARSGERNFEVEDKDGALEQLVSGFQKQFPAARVTRLDGIKVETEDDAFWFNARKSNTEPLVRVNAEAASAEALDRNFARIQEVLGEPVAH